MPWTDDAWLGWLGKAWDKSTCTGWLDAEQWEQRGEDDIAALLRRLAGTVQEGSQEQFPDSVRDLVQLLAAGKLAEPKLPRRFLRHTVWGMSRAVSWTGRDEYFAVVKFDPRLATDDEVEEAVRRAREVLGQSRRPGAAALARQAARVAALRTIMLITRREGPADFDFEGDEPGAEEAGEMVELASVSARDLFQKEELKHIRASWDAFASTDSVNQWVRESIQRVHRHYAGESSESLAKSTIERAVRQIRTECKAKKESRAVDLRAVDLLEAWHRDTGM